MVNSTERLENALSVTTSLSGCEVDVMKSDPENNDGDAKDSATEVVGASNATFTIDGIAVTRSTNTITDLFSGITMDLDDVSASDLGTDQTISSRYSETDALSILETVVSEINFLLSFLQEQSKPGTNGEDGGPLNGDHFIR